jgi:hypothetical protein
MAIAAVSDSAIALASGLPEHFVHRLVVVCVSFLYTLVHTARRVGFAFG